ncbi:hypothetical protein Desmer_2060 [Desulfosporosinus meridiei DSM 13257]|uniref:Uncharacterized protein n=1 Tax=Desulfosporosinus meridiei (strain ATCC BAA-275 / DSM 13257 / KCTC 12902 / NCIMB 13706 / S10) TaxID=768704 RepID=J7IQU5_DESMD|nr:hypothetical protein Desmer_2060 [Desulfosporosinus meridiei DSM 13257]
MTDTVTDAYLQRVRRRTTYLLKFGSGSEFELQPGSAFFRYLKGRTGAIHPRYGYRGND